MHPWLVTKFQTARKDKDSWTKWLNEKLNNLHFTKPCWWLGRGG